MKLSRLILVLTMFAPIVVAQVPDGWYVVSSFKTFVFPNSAIPFLGDGGLFFVHPRQPGNPTPVTGLPASLTGSGRTSGNWGANNVLWRPTDGALIVGTATTGGAAVHLHILTLTGAAVRTNNSIPLGVGRSIGEASVNQASLLPNGDILVAVANIASGILAGASLGIVSPASGIVTPVSVTGISRSGEINAVATDATGQTAYLGIFHNTGSGSVWSVAVPGGGGATWIANVTGGVMNLDIDNNGRILAGTFGVGTGMPPHLFRIDPASGSVANISAGTSAAVQNAVAVERATGNYAVFMDGGTATRPLSGVGWMPPGGTPQLLSSGPPAGWGLVSGIAINRNPETYGTGTPGANAYSWRTTPNPGGLPEAGSTSFSLTLASSPGTGTTLSAWFMSTNRASFSLPPITLRLGAPLLGPFFIRNPTLGNPTTIPLPLPTNPALLQTNIYVQSVHLDGATLAASEGLRFSIL